MQNELKIVFRDVSPSPAMEAAIRSEMESMEHYFDRITSCRVTVAEPHRHHRRGNLYSIRIDLTVPGRELVINHDHPLDHSHEDPYLAVRQAFHSARRVLEDYVRQMRGEVKAHTLTRNAATEPL